MHELAVEPSDDWLPFARATKEANLAVSRSECNSIFVSVSAGYSLLGV